MNPNPVRQIQFHKLNPDDTPQPPHTIMGTEPPTTEPLDEIRMARLVDTLSDIIARDAASVSTFIWYVPIRDGWTAHHAELATGELARRHPNIDIIRVITTDNPNPLRIDRVPDTTETP